MNIESGGVPPGGDVHRRLDRIESRLDQIAALLERLARVEERQQQHDANYHVGMDRIHERVDELFRRVEKLDVNNAHTDIVVKWIQMIFWLIIAGALAIIGKHIFGPELLKFF